MFLGTWRDLLLGQIEECYAELEAKVRSNKANVIAQWEEGCLEAGGGVTKFLFLVPEDLDEVSVEES